MLRDSVSRMSAFQLGLAALRVLVLLKSALTRHPSVPVLPYSASGTIEPARCCQNSDPGARSNDALTKEQRNSPKLICAQN
jgi:hypothetical protein